MGLAIRIRIHTMVSGTTTSFYKEKKKKINKLMVLRLFKNSAIPTKYRTNRQSWTLLKKYCQLIVFCFTSLSLIFFLYIKRPPRRALNYKIINIYYHNPFSESKDYIQGFFCSIIIANFKKRSSRKAKDFFFSVNFPILDRQKDPVRKS